MPVESIRIFDAGIDYDLAERFIVEFDRRHIYGMSIDCHMPNGYCQYLGERIEFDFCKLVQGREIVPLEKAPDSVKRQIAFIKRVFD
jgi:hypothetical protein